MFFTSIPKSISSIDSILSMDFFISFNVYPILALFVSNYALLVNLTLKTRISSSKLLILNCFCSSSDFKSSTLFYNPILILSIFRSLAYCASCCYLEFSDMKLFISFNSFFKVCTSSISEYPIPFDPLPLVSTMSFKVANVFCVDNLKFAKS